MTATATGKEPTMRKTSRRELIDVALGDDPADLVVEDTRLVNVATGEIYDAGVAVKGDRIAAVGDVAYAKGPDTEVVSGEGRFLTPGLIDGHLHCYHSYLGVREFTEVMLGHGVTATADGFYGQGIVGGMEAIRFFKEAFERMPLRLIFLVPTLSYLQNRELGLTPTPGIEAPDMTAMLDWPGCYGLEEPPFLPIVEKYDEFLDLFEETLDRRKVITGHAAGIGWRQMQAYVAMGTATDHESTEVGDALAKARAGMKLLIRQGSGAPDVPEVVRTHTEHGIDPRALGFCADLASPEKLLNEGGVDANVRVAIANGVSPIHAIQMGTINVAEAFFAQQDIGVIAPGRFADMVFVDNLVEFEIDRVMVGGRTVVRGGELQEPLEAIEYPESFYGTVHLSSPVESGDLVVRAEADEVEARVIGVTDGSLETDERRARLRVADGAVQPDLERDVLMLAMVDRHGKGTGIGAGFVQGFGLRGGAIASSVNAVCENVVIVGTNPDDMAVAANRLAESGGGKVVVEDGAVRALVELPLLGLLAEDPLDAVMAKFDPTFDAISALGCELHNPFSQLEFCFACGEIGEIKLSEEGLVRTDPPSKLEVIVE
jgi:adenine deaminase